MLGVIGFSVMTGIIATYAVLLPRLYARVQPALTYKIASAFGFLALAFATWACVAAIAPTAQTLAVWLIAANIFLIAGSAQMLEVSIDTIKRPWILHVFWIVAVALLIARLTVHPSNAEVVDGIVYFRLSNEAIAVVAGLFAATWLPACLKLVRHIKSVYPDMNVAASMLGMSYAMMIVVCGWFMATQREITVILSFVCLGIVFVGSLALGLLVKYKSKPVKYKKGVLHG